MPLIQKKLSPHQRIATMREVLSVQLAHFLCTKQHITPLAMIGCKNTDDDEGYNGVDVSSKYDDYIYFGTPWHSSEFAVGVIEDMETH